MHSITIITGASAGLGVEFARQIRAQDKATEIWLIARREDRLEKLAQEIGHARVFALDLTNRTDLNSFCATLQQIKPDIRLLVNNAGWGKYGNFADHDADEMLNMIDLNVSALTWLSSICLPYMSSGSGIVQVASSAGFIPIGRFAVYAATKAYGISFSNALAGELKPRGISVTAVCPGPVNTEFFDRASGLDGRLIVCKISAESVVQKALADHKKRRWFSVYGWDIKVFTLFAPLLPRKIAVAITQWVNRKN